MPEVEGQGRGQDPQAQVPLWPLDLTAGQERFLSPAASAGKAQRGGGELWEGAAGRPALPTPWARPPEPRPRATAPHARSRSGPTGPTHLPCLRAELRGRLCRRAGRPASAGASSGLPWGARAFVTPHPVWGWGQGAGAQGVAGRPRPVGPRDLGACGRRRRLALWSQGPDDGGNRWVSARTELFTGFALFPRDPGAPRPGGHRGWSQS